ncbi:MAG: protein kinase [Oscillospiraceae bacterium]|nr:protein kinase [Oscillospiraceae bacterium]
MSEPKLISPLLDGFSIGSAVSEHDGVRCYPALKENSERKYIVKVLSIPASQVQLDALLLTGAYTAPSDAMEYFKELAEQVEKEAAVLKNLSKVEGFLAYEGWQVVPMQDRLGYEVYLLSSYRHALENYVRRNNMTHLGAVNLGIDICTALSAARRAGWIYADLKPSNIYISGNKEYRIGDLGLMELAGLELAALPAKYRSAYTAPELFDDLVSPNTTMDTYALGLILYQIFNNGQLPQVPHPTEDLPDPPVNADYEMAEIILKACHPDPAQRWEDPVQMGQALVAYMQRNVVNDVPIIPPIARIDNVLEPGDLEDSTPDETLPGMNNDQEIRREELSREMSEMIAQAEDLMDLEPPAPPIVPESTSLEQLEADVIRAAEEKRLQQEELRQQQLREAEEDQQRQLREELEAEKKIREEVERAEADAANRKRIELAAAAKAQKAALDAKKKEALDLNKQVRRMRRKRFLVSMTVVLLVLALAAGAYLFYTNYYVQMITGLSVTGAEDHLSVRLDTDIPDDLLTVICTDTQGNTKHQPVVDGTASFDGLLPDMLYTIHVEMEGFHRLDGSTTHEYTTPAETRITGFTAITGPEDGTVILSFAVEGPDSSEWTAICEAQGEETVEASFTGHLTTITGLTVGKTYAIRLVPTAELYIPGASSLEFTAASIVVAENLAIVPSGEDAVTITWDIPEGDSAKIWNVRCYSTAGYDQSITTDQFTAVFDGIDFSNGYTVEITAEGMTQSARISMTENPLRLQDIQVDASVAQQLKVTWNYEGSAPEGGWLLTYTIDGNGKPQIVPCTGNQGIIEVRVPGATYDISIQAADGTTVFDGTHSFTTPDAALYRNKMQAIFEHYHTSHLFVNLLKTPEKTNWNHRDVYTADFTTSFRSGDSISMMLYYMVDFYIYHEDITLMYVIRDEEGKVVSDLIGMENKDWNDDMWNGPNYHYCCLNIPKAPTEPGEYTLSLYFDGGAITTVSFTVTE